ncbi:hypothetical protein SCHPADRAFT_940272 [Schizopora paradoxa]|uniref:BTB domain-containing protein n=1 Tax=Schizopora paradoxa TaxID=27342 RepID=A0A0H2RPS6_9AGAM|nr:hypothetical protein SCHPADRAFT_940272 [Schizopora paradoxa]
MANEGQDNGGEGETFTKHDSLWLSDGNIILAAASSASSSDERSSMVFRVHKSVLSRQSQVFSDMFALPTQSTTSVDNDDIMDGLPLIRMHDSAEEIEALLKYLYDPIRDVAFTRFRHPDFPQKSQVLLQLADKYGLDGIKSNLIELFKSHWPKTSAEWAHTDAIRDTVKEKKYTVDTWPEELLPEPISAALIALQYNVKEVLPSIIYELYRCPPSADWDQQARERQSFKPEGRGARWKMANVKILHLRNIVAERGDSELTALWSYGCWVSITRSSGFNSRCFENLKCDPILAAKRHEALRCPVGDWLKMSERIKAAASSSAPGLCGTCENELLRYADSNDINSRWRNLVHTLNENM